MISLEENNFEIRKMPVFLRSLPYIWIDVLQVDLYIRSRNHITLLEDRWRRKIQLDIENRVPQKYIATLGVVFFIRNSLFRALKQGTGIEVNVILPSYSYHCKFKKYTFVAFCTNRKLCCGRLYQELSFNSEKKKKVQPRMEMTQMKEDVLVSEKYHRTFYNK